MMKVKVPAADGVPVSAPAEDRVMPDGRVPEATVQEYGFVPPDPARVCE